MALLRKQLISLTRLPSGVLSAIVNRPRVTVLPLRPSLSCPTPPPSYRPFSCLGWRSSECTFIAGFSRTEIWLLSSQCSTLQSAGYFRVYIIKRGRRSCTERNIKCFKFIKLAFISIDFSLELFSFNENEKDMIKNRKFL